MFTIEKPKQIKWPVTVSIPRDGGNATKAVFTAHFKMIPANEFNAIYQGGGNDEDLLRTVVAGFGDDVCDESGAPLVFSQESLDQLIGIPYVRNALVSAYLDLSQGKKAAAKN